MRRALKRAGSLKMNMRIPGAIALTSLILAGCASSTPPSANWLPTPSATAESMPRVQTYEGAQRPREQVAIVYATDAGPRYQSSYICSVDGVDLRRSSGFSSYCSAVVYVLPGLHRIGWRYRSFNSIGHGELPVQVEAGGLYQVNPSSLLDGSRGVTNLITMSPKMTLTWRNLAPSRSAHLDDAVPYAPN